MKPGATKRFEKPFVEAVLCGEASPAEIDDYLHAWHDSKAGLDLELHEFFGFTTEEYERWIWEPDAVDEIIAAHRRGVA